MPTMAVTSESRGGDVCSDIWVRGRRRLDFAPVFSAEGCYDTRIMRTCVRVDDRLRPAAPLRALSSRRRSGCAAGPGAAALAPEPGREQLVGEVSPAAGAVGVHAGDAAGGGARALPSLALVPPDPVGVADAWEGVLGAAGEHRRGRRGAAAGDGFLRRAWSASSVRRAVARRSGMAGPGRNRGPPRIAYPGADRCRSVALLRACGCNSVRARGARRSMPGAAALAGEPVALLRGCERPRRCVEPLERLGLLTLGAVAALARAAMADRFGAAGAARARAGQRARHATAPARAGRGAAGDARAARGRLRGRRLTARWSCSSTGCWPAASGAGGRCARSCCRRGWSRAARGASASSSARRWPIRRGCAWRSAGACAAARACRDAAAGAWSASGRRTRRRGAVRRRRRALRASACARRCARRARRPARMRRCASSSVDPDSRVPERRAVLAPFDDDAARGRA